MQTENNLSVKFPITRILLFKICTFPYSKNVAVVLLVWKTEDEQ